MGAERVENYRQVLIYALGAHLKELDGEAVIGDEIRNALQEIEAEQAADKCKVYKNWKSCREVALRTVEKFNERVSKARRSTVGGASRGSFMGRGSYAAPSPSSLSQQQLLSISEIEIESDDEKDENGNKKKKKEADEGVGFWDAPSSDNGPNDANLGAQLNSVWSGVSSITGSILTKLEILISYVQMFGLIYTIDFSLNWPNLWYVCILC